MQIRTAKRIYISPHANLSDVYATAIVLALNPKAKLYKYNAEYSYDTFYDIPEYWFIGCGGRLDILNNCYDPTHVVEEQLDNHIAAIKIKTVLDYVINVLQLSNLKNAEWVRLASLQSLPDKQHTSRYLQVERNVPHMLTGPIVWSYIKEFSDNPKEVRKTLLKLGEMLLRFEKSMDSRTSIVDSFPKYKTASGKLLIDARNCKFMVSFIKNTLGTCRPEYLLVDDLSHKGPGTLFSDFTVGGINLNTVKSKQNFYKIHGKGYMAVFKTGIDPLPYILHNL